MPSLESEAIILRTTSLGEADKLVSFFSRSYGRLRGVAPAARKSRRRFGPALEPLTHVRVWFFEKENRELIRLEQCEVLESFWEQAPDYERSVAFNHIAEISELLLPEREPHEKNFRLTLLTLRALKQGIPKDLALGYFQLWSARLAGWLTELHRCGQCGDPLNVGSLSYFSPSEGRLYCSRCRPAGTRSFGPVARTLALQMLDRPLEQIHPGEGSATHLRELQRALLDLIEHHGERKLATRELLHASN